MPSNSLPPISVIGLGKLGSPAAAVFASKGMNVIGVDVNAQFVEAINNGRAPVQESGLVELIRKHKKRLSATTDMREAVLSSTASFIIVPTPSKKDKTFSNDYVLDAVKAIGKVLREKKGWHLVVVCSTVMPGSMDSVIKPCLEKASGRRVGKNVGLCYNPEFIALGTVIRDMLNPDIILIGESDKKSGNFLEKLYTRTCESNPAIKRMNYVNAELTKISINTFVTTKISYANMLSDICDNLPNADCNVVTDAVGSDSRIGKKYMKGATGYGGPCFPRDNAAFAALAIKSNARPDLAVATDSINTYQPQRLMALIRRAVPKAKKIAVLGLSYKPDTGVIEESHGIKLASLLQKSGYKVTAYDRVANGQEVRDALPLGTILSPTLDQAFTDQDAVVIMVSDAAFRKFRWPVAKGANRPVTIIDCWRLLEGVRLPSHVTLIHPGKYAKLAKTEFWDETDELALPDNVTVIYPERRAKSSR
jgi:UDPglucose 6-dehydrogenase